jgi:stearoyl-CoA desaturase (delta-9 desaturase)
MAQGAAELARETSVPGTVKLEAGQVRAQKVAVLALSILPFAGMVAAAVSLWGRGLSGADVTTFALMYVFTGLGVTVGYHRLLTHRSFNTSSRVRIVLAVAGSMAVEGSVISWVANHRRHHAFADKEGDPHSPHLEEGEGLGAVFKGLWHAHLGWLFDDEKTEITRWAPDLLKEPGMVRVDRAFPALTAATFIVPTLLGFLLTRSVAGALTALLWGGLARVFVLHHITFSVNSVCHFFGRRPFDTKDYSTNNWVLALVSFGESWHNNHHAFPTSAVHGIGRWQLDLSAMVISVLQRLGLAHDVKRADEKRLAQKKRADEKRLAEKQRAA